MIGFLLILLLVAAFIFGLIWSIIQEREYSRTGIKYIKPVPYFGNLLKTCVGIERFSDTINKIYDTFEGERYVAMFAMFSPAIVLRDPELIKKTMIKDSDCFHDFSVNIDETVDPIFGKTILTLRGKKWKQMRSTLSSALTSLKMKNMFNFIDDCAKNYVSFFEEECHKHGSIDLDIHDTNTRFTNDSIASAAFGLEINSLRDRNNDFYIQAGLATKQTLTIVVKFIAFRMFPSLMKKLGFTLMPKSSTNYLIGVIGDAMDRREANGEYRPDMIHLFNEAKKGNLKHSEDGETSRKEFASTEEYSIGTSIPRNWTKDDLVPQGLVFIAGGYTNTSAVLDNLFYELCVNQDIQDKLRKEIDEVLEQNDGNISYNDLIHMSYLDMVISETLRIWTPAPIAIRSCGKKEYDFGPMNAESDRSFKIKENYNIWIPVHCIHMDSKYWPNPTKFDPERFSEENKPNILPQTYMPFGLGPRNCLGTRLALMIMKVLVFHLLAKFKFEPCSRTVIPIRIRQGSFGFESKDGYWFKMTKRSF